MSLSKTIRFEVFKRDSFTCQYCGATPPKVTLEADHIKPRAEGGDDSLLNLITACGDCNRGKSARELSDDSIVVRQKQQLDELNERRLQLEMMLEWREGLKELHQVEVDAFERAFKLQTTHVINENGRKSVEKWFKRYSLIELLDALEGAVDSYLREDANGKSIGESVDKVFNMIPRIASWKRRGGIPDYLRRMFYIRAVLRNRIYVNERMVMDLLQQAYDKNVDLDSLETYSKSVANWTQWRTTLEDFIGSH